MSNEWSNDATTSLTLPTGATDPNQRIVLDGTSDTILVYDNSGALIASVAATAGTDAEGNNYPAGISATSGIVSQSIILLYNGTPTVGNLAMSLASTAGSDTFGNNYQAGFTVYDSSENVVRSIDFTGLDTVGSATDAQFIIDPTTGLISLLTAANAVTAIIDAAHGSMNFYTTTTTSTTITATGTFLVPTNITSMRAQVWASGGGGQGGSGAGGGGGEYAEEPALTVIPGETLNVHIGSVGTGGVGGVGGPGTSGGSSFVARGATNLVLAHGGQGSSSATTVGGTGSTNSIHHDGGGSHANTTGVSHGGAGGGSSAGTSAAGTIGASNSGTTGGAGGVAPSGGGNGGAGGAGTGTSGTAGTAGSIPGGGGGAGGAGSSSNSAGGNGARGQIKLTYTNTATMEVSIAAMAGTDEFGNSYPAGIQVGIPTSSRIFLNPTGPVVNTYDSNNKLTSQLNPSAGTFTVLDNVNLFFTQMNTTAVAGGGILAGNITAAGSLPTATQITEAASYGGQGGFANIFSGTTATSGTGSASAQGSFGLGDPTATFATGTTPTFTVLSGNSSAPTLGQMGGAWIHFDQALAIPESWQTPSLGTGWTFSGIRSSNPLRYRRDAEDNLILQGSISCTSTTPASTVFVLPSGYIPQAAWNLQQGLMLKQNSSGVGFVAGHLFVSSANVSQNGFTFTSGDIITFNHSFPLGNIL